MLTPLGLNEFEFSFLDQIDPLNWLALLVYDLILVEGLGGPPQMVLWDNLLALVLEGVTVSNELDFVVYNVFLNQGYGQIEAGHL